MFTSHHVRRRLLSVAAVSALAALTGCLATTRVLSPGPAYYGDRPVEKVYVYFFIDMRPEYISDVFRRQVSEGLSAALRQSNIPNEQLWFADTVHGQILQSDMKSHTHYNATSVSVGGTIQENAARDSALAPSHRLIVFPRETLRSGNGAVLNVKWDLMDSKSGHLEWSVFTQTPVLSRSMDPNEAASAANGFVSAIVEELRARQVIPRPKT